MPAVSLLCSLILDCIFAMLLFGSLIYLGDFRAPVMVCFMNADRHWHQHRAICVCPCSCPMAPSIYFSHIVGIENEAISALLLGELIPYILG